MTTSVYASHNSFLLHASSRQKHRYDSSNANFHVANGNTDSRTNEVVKIVPLFVSVPNLFGNVNRYTDTIYATIETARVTRPVDLDDPGPVYFQVPKTGDEKTVKVARKNYTAADLVGALDAAFAAASVPLTVTWDSAKFNYTLTNSGSSAVFLRTEAHGLLEMLGFEGDIQVPANGTAVSPVDSANLNPIRMVFIHSNRFAPANALSGRLESILWWLDMKDVRYGAVATSTNNSDMFVYDVQFVTDTKSVQHYDFKLTDQHMRVLDMPDSHHWDLILKCYHHKG